MARVITQRRRWNANFFFTMLWYFEIMLVIAILGLLVGSAIRAYSQTIRITQTTATVSSVAFLKSMIYRFYVFNRRWPETGDIVLNQDHREEMKQIREIRIYNGSFEIEFNDYFPNLESKVLAFRRAQFSNVPGSTTIWLCGYQPVPTGMSVDRKNTTTVSIKDLPYICK